MGSAKKFIVYYEKLFKSDYCSKVNTKDEFDAVVKILRCCGCKQNILPLFNKSTFDKGFLEDLKIKKNGKLKKEKSMLTYNIYLHNLCEYIIAFKLFRTYQVKWSTVNSFQARLDASFFFAINI